MRILRKKKISQQIAGKFKTNIFTCLPIHTADLPIMRFKIANLEHVISRFFESLLDFCFISQLEMKGAK